MLSNGDIMIEADKWNALIRVFFVLIVITSFSDIVADVLQGANVLHIVQESVVFVFALSLLLLLFLNTRAHEQRNAQLLVDLEEAKIHSAQASEELVSAKRMFGEEITKQFIKWELTESESDIALFTLKGFSAKEIADFRNTSEKTVRNQLTSVYKKSGTTSKVSFTAWFMEDLW
ncbi:regulatory protein, luxR family [Amphritea atlantica]|uniref:Regulatory protein, luxR family n=2 Tax=Amphritea atlantica TaxID=355243 RepID=A0A1H9HUZ1_9GAMM|nr:regulatory protein, luxR family [Amphritea atlantica]